MPGRSLRLLKISAEETRLRDTRNSHARTSKREAALPKNEAHTRRLKTHLSALDHGREWVTKCVLRRKNAPSSRAEHFGRRADLATGGVPVG
jgi:hypothetical protein